MKTSSLHPHVFLVPVHEPGAPELEETARLEGPDQYSLCGRMIVVMRDPLDAYAAVSQLALEQVAGHAPLWTVFQ